MRAVLQPGPPAPERVVAAPVALTPLELELAPGPSLRDALAGELAARGLDGAALRLAAGAFGPFGYVMPALSPDAAHAAFYSAPFRPEGSSPVEAGALTAGWRDGAPFYHCHAIWTEPDGRRAAGHVLPDETGIAETLHLSGVGFTGARFETRPDAETGFALLTPVATHVPARPGGFAIRLRPNQDLTLALESLCRARGIARARLHGGVGSVIGARFAGGAGDTDIFATEMFLISAEIDCADPARTAVEAALVDLTGAIGSGRLVRGDNPVLMTLEAVLEPL